MNIFEELFTGVMVTLVVGVAYIPLIGTSYMYKTNGEVPWVSWVLSILFMFVYSLILVRIANNSGRR